MNFFINTPNCYVTDIVIEDEIHKFCSYISRNIDVKKYTDDLDTIGIVPQIASADSSIEEKHISKAYKFANIDLVTDYEEFLNSDLQGRKSLIIDNILRSAKVIKKKLGKSFNYDEFEKDILRLQESFSEEAYWDCF